jgi:hypothetical protein
MKIKNITNFFNKQTKLFKERIIIYIPIAWWPVNSFCKIYVFICITKFDYKIIKKISCLLFLDVIRKGTYLRLHILVCVHV